LNNIHLILLYVNLIYGCHEYEVAPFPHEEDPLICEQAKTRQAREAKQSQSEEESAYKNKVSRALTSQELGHTPNRFWNPPISSDTL
jgi:hypothetical protein